MRITIELGRPRRRSIAFLLALTALAPPTVVLASHQFTDVPPGHPFHDEIGAIADAGITAGFNDGTYRPGDPVTRQAMAAFMERGFGRHAMAVGGTPLNLLLELDGGDNGALALPVRDITMTVPGATSAFSPQQLVYLHGRVALEASMSTANQGCPCTFEAYIRDETDDIIFLPQYQTFESSATGIQLYSFDVDAFFMAPPGSHTYTLEVGLFGRASAVPAANFGFDDSTTLTAMTFPFSAQ